MHVESTNWALWVIYKDTNLEGDVLVVSMAQRKVEWKSRCENIQDTMYSYLKFSKKLIKTTTQDKN